MSRSGPIVATRFSVKEVSFAPASVGCETCGARCRRRWRASRVALDLHLDGPQALLVSVGVYRCLRCERWFRAQPPFLRPNAIYTQRVVRTAVAAVVSDGMAISHVPHRLARDFGLRPSEATVRGWVRAWTDELNLSEDYEPWVVQTFSGVLCLDEVYEGRLALLLAVEPGTPQGDRLVGYQLVTGSVDGQEVERFLTRLRECGVHPEQVVTDGSALYPAALAQVWPEAAHQLCLFHETRHFVKGVAKVIQDVLTQLPAAPRRAPAQTGRLREHHDPSGPSSHDRAARIALVRELRTKGMGIRAIVRTTGHSRNTVRAWLRGTVELPEELPVVDVEELLADSRRSEEKPLFKPPPDPWSTWEEVREVKKTLTTMRYTLTRRGADCSDQQRESARQLFASPVGVALETAHRFLQSWYAIWKDTDGHRRSLGEAKRRYLALMNDGDVAELPALRRLQDKMGDAHFASLAPFLTQAHWRATSNACERKGRMFRHIQHRHFRLRTTRAIDGALRAHAVDRMAPLDGRRASQAARSSRGRRPKSGPQAPMVSRAA